MKTFNNYKNYKILIYIFCTLGLTSFLYSMEEREQREEEEIIKEFEMLQPGVRPEFITIQNLSNQCTIFARVYKLKGDVFEPENGSKTFTLNPETSQKISLPKKEIEVEDEEEEEKFEIIGERTFILVSIDPRLLDISLSRVNIERGTNEINKNHIKFYEIQGRINETLIADIRIPGEAQPLFGDITDCSDNEKAQVVFVKGEKTKHKPLSIENKTGENLYFAIYECERNLADPIGSMYCNRKSKIYEIERNNSIRLTDITYDPRISEGDPRFTAFIIFSLFKGDLKETRDAKLSTMRQIVRGTTRLTEAHFDLFANKDLDGIKIDRHETGLLIEGATYLKQLGQWAYKQVVSWTPSIAASILKRTEYGKFSQPFTDMIERIARNKARTQRQEVLVEDSLAREETEAIKNRSITTEKALETLLAHKFHNYPRIALCLSGGGYRAMISSIGFVQGLQDEKILDAITYMSTLSGSTWLMMKYLSEIETKGQDSIAKLRQDIEKQVVAGSKDPAGIGIIYPRNVTELARVVAAIFPKYVFYQEITISDIYGTMLGYNLFTKLENTIALNGFSSLAKTVLSGKAPFSIGTAVSGEKDWFEFTPFTIGTTETKKPVFVPSVAFGKRFINGNSVDDALEIPIHNLMAMFGSAYALKGADFAKHLKPEQLKQIQDSLKGTEFEGLINDLQTAIGQFATLAVKEKVKQAEEYAQGSIGQFTALETEEKVKKAQQYIPGGITLFEPDKDAALRLPGGIVPNFLFELDESIRGQGKYEGQTMEFRDAGIEFNLPFPPLLRKERDINIIIALDAGSDVLTGGPAKVMQEASEYAKKYNLNFPDITDEIKQKLVSENFTVIGDPDDPKALIIIYIPIMKNPKLTGFENFEPLNEPWTGTFNFNYSSLNFNKLVDFNLQNVTAMKDDIITIIGRKTKALNPGEIWQREIEQSL